MNYKVKIDWDDEAKVWVATSSEVSGLVLESGSYDELIERVKKAIPELVELNNGCRHNYTVSFVSERLEKVA